MARGRGEPADFRDRRHTGASTIRGPRDEPGPLMLCRKNMWRQTIHAQVVCGFIAGTTVLSGCAIPEAGNAKHTLSEEYAPDRFLAGDDDLHDRRGETADDMPDMSGWWRRLGDDTLGKHLDAVVARATEHNRDLHAAAARIDAAVAQARTAGADLLPSVSAALDAQRQRQVFVGLPIPGSGGVVSNTNNRFGVALNLSWEADLWGRIRAGQAAANADIVATAADWAAARESLAAQTVRAFFASVEAAQQLELAERSAGSFSTTAEQVRTRFVRGTAPPLDLRLALGNKAAAEAAIRERTEQLERARRQLELLLGRYPSGRALEAETVLPTTLPPVPVGLPSTLLERRPDLVAAEQRLAATDHRLTASRRALLPRVSLTASGGTTSEDFEDLLDGDFLVWSVAGNLLQPIFEGGRLRADIQRSQARVAEAAANWESTILQAFTEVESALASERQAMERVRKLEELQTQQAAALRLAEDRYRRGLTDFLTVADSQRAALDAESRWLTARRQMIDVRIDLHLALGGGFDTQEGTPLDTSPED